MKNFTVGLIAIVMAIVAISMPQPVYAVCGEGTNTPKDQVLVGAGQTGADCKGLQVNNTIDAAVRILSTIVGVAAVIMIIISGLKYVTSGGDSGKTASAKSTLIYSLIGLAIAALAPVLVGLVFDVAGT